jgi:exportin-5
MSASTFEKYTIPLLQADTQFAVVEATLRGYNKWVDIHGKMPQQDVSDPECPHRAISLTMPKEQQRCVLEAALESWALNLMQKKFEVRNCYWEWQKPWY